MPAERAAIARHDSHAAPVLFAADMHLDPDRPAVTEAFLRFLASDAARAQALYLLGDLFEAWIGDDAVPPEHPVLAALRRLTDSGVSLWLMHGNRDFLLGEGFEAATGGTLLPEPSLIRIDDEPVLIEHGDALCTDDGEYQRFRAIVRDPAWQSRFLALSVSERLAQARQARAQSSQHGQATADAIMDVNPGAVAERFREFGVRRLIHGHTHRPAVHESEVDGTPVTRIVLGDWFEQGSLLRVTDGEYRLETLPLPRK
ncbi:UDP-2,3-diacylglucosamine diphosphatase [Sediminicurvatus halobius]|uniref:UDP-2,3-diacylglucosamine hydrolase n=1 Tax=Sediminicurvatus halobius TaxID=2182432 RepID=A0A2U2N606_9GAMM|nr:UDP-2,3-diacylglucosamine diphosphatase [Spiribacter halobius]PWG64616.1 UDP-2,3-diacylglucosamine diphosphatase [Spiribacter halobius]UEX79061.1 UDP-2,3-diacylglucosamine diphosphatase [Spiribacter halobius]